MIEVLSHALNESRSIIGPIVHNTIILTEPPHIMSNKSILHAFPQNRGSSNNTIWRQVMLDMVKHNGLLLQWPRQAMQQEEHGY